MPSKPIKAEVTATIKTEIEFVKNLKPKEKK